MACSKAKARTMLNTLPMAASRMSMMAGFSDIRICLTMGITTAEAVPPNMQPNIMLTIGSKSKSNHPTSQMATADRMKLNAVSFKAPPKESFNALNLSCVPLSNKMVTKVMPEKRLPALPRLSGEIQWKTGPISRPMMMRNSTSGMRLRLKISLKRWAVKMSKPMMAMVRPICRDELPLETCSTTLLTKLGFARLSAACVKVSSILERVLVVGMRSV